MVIDVLLFLLLISMTWVALCTGCEYRNYKGGHKFIRAFNAQGRFQKFFLLLQTRKDIDVNDIGKLTYIGFVGAIISSITAIFVLPTTIYLYFLGNHEIVTLIFQSWVLMGTIWGVASLVIQGIDSIINRF